MDQVGFWQLALTKALPSTTKRFLTSCDCSNRLRTDFLGSLPMRAVPSSWMDQPSVAMRLLTCRSEAGVFEHFLGGDDHVLGHGVLVFAEFVVEAKRGDAPFVFYDGVEVYVILVASKDFAETAHVDEKRPRYRLVCAALFLTAVPVAGIAQSASRSIPAIEKTG